MSRLGMLINQFYSDGHNVYYTMMTHSLRRLIFESIAALWLLHFVSMTRVARREQGNDCMDYHVLQIHTVY